jgi:hypothetical protein
MQIEKVFELQWLEPKWAQRWIDARHQHFPEGATLLLNSLQWNWALMPAVLCAGLQL